MQTENGVKENPCFILRLSVENENNMLRIEIEDHGPGMDKTTQTRVFEPFFTTKPVGIGTGLGLSVSYFIITQNHGGTMDVVSTLGKGTTFIVRLPLERTGGINEFRS
jgi:signal transduction histidine kinase